MKNKHKKAMLKLADLIEQTDRFTLRYYEAVIHSDGHFGWGPEDIDLYGDCGTAGCVCGWQNAIMEREDLSDKTTAAEDLGLTEDQAIELFCPAGPKTVWGMKNPYLATAAKAATVLREIACGIRTFECDKVTA